MKTFYIMNLATDEWLGEVEALDIAGAEFKACGIWADIDSDYLVAFTNKF